MLRAGSFILFVIIAWSTASIACEPFDDQGRYRIEHEVLGHVGEEVLTIRCEDDLVIVDRTIDVDVRLLLVSLYQRQAHYTEVWRGDRLESFQGLTDDNGKRAKLDVALEDDQTLMARGVDQPKKLPRTAIPTDPWHLDLAKRTQLFDRLDGRLIEVKMIDAGDDKVKIGGKWMEARKFVVSEGRQQELWFDRNSGFWLKSTIHHQSGTITITRERADQSIRLAGVTTNQPAAQPATRP